MLFAEKLNIKKPVFENEINIRFQKLLITKPLNLSTSQPLSLKIYAKETNKNERE